MREKQLKELDFGIEVINDILDRMNSIHNNIEKSNSDNSILLKEDIFLNELDLDFLFKNIYILYGEEYLNEFQLAYANKVVSAIKNKIPYDEAYLNIQQTDDGYYYILISTIVEEVSYPLLIINFYLKQIYYVEDENTNHILNEIESLKEEVKELEEYYEKLELSKENPLHYAGDNSLKMMDMIFRKKKYEEEIGREKANTLDSISICNNKIYQYKAMLSEMEMDKIKCSILIDKYIDRLTKYYNYTLIKNDNTYKEESVSTTFSENP